MCKKFQISRLTKTCRKSLNHFCLTFMSHMMLYVPIKMKHYLEELKKIQPNSSLTLKPNVSLLMLTWAVNPM